MDLVLNTNNEATSTFSLQNWTEEDSRLVFGIFSRLVMEKEHQIAADMMVAKGRDIPDAEELFRALTETNTTVKLFFVKSEDVEEAMEKMPKLIPAVPGTMRIHKVITLAPEELMVRDVSCMCTTRKQFNCKCFNTQYFSFGQKMEMAVSQQASGGNPEKEIQWESPELMVYGVF